MQFKQTNQSGKKSHKIRNIIIGIIAFIIIISIASNANKNATTVTTTASTPPTSAQAKAAPAAKVGDTVAIGGDKGLAVKLMQVIDPAQSDNQYTTPATGKRFVGAKLQITNNGSAAYNDDANNNLSLIGSDNQSYTASFDAITGCTNFSSGQYTLAVGASATGCVVYQVPSGVNAARLQFTSLSGLSGNTAEWVVQ